jgi:hypothetical protein
MKLLPITLLCWFEAFMSFSQRIVARGIRLLNPFVRRAGYDMLLLKNGSWVEFDGSLQDAEILGNAIYFAESHQIAATTNPISRVKKWPWLSVLAGSKDMTGFFESLRVANGIEITPHQVFMLSAHQTGCITTTPTIIVTTRLAETLELANPFILRV